MLRPWRSVKPQERCKKKKRANQADTQPRKEAYQLSRSAIKILQGWECNASLEALLAQLKIYSLQL